MTRSPRGVPAKRSITNEWAPGISEIGQARGIDPRYGQGWAYQVRALRGKNYRRQWSRISSQYRGGDIRPEHPGELHSGVHPSVPQIDHGTAQHSPGRENETD